MRVGRFAQRFRHQKTSKGSGTKGRELRFGGILLMRRRLRQDVASRRLAKSAPSGRAPNWAMPVAFRYRIAAYARSAAASDFVEPRRTEGRMDGRILAEASHRRRLMLDGLRGVAAIAVVIYHFTSHTDFWAMRGAYFAVDLFFCLSGFVLAENYRARLAQGLSVGEFMMRRLIRLYPLYLSGTLIGFTALALKTTIGATNYSFSDLLSALQYNLLFLPYLNVETVVNFGHPDIGQLFPTNVAAWTLF